jgi:hypothetical protein
MNTATCLVALALVAASAATGAAEGPKLVPPPEYDHPYYGVLIVIPARDQNHVREMCPKTKFPPMGALGCTILQKGTCWVVMAPDADIKAAGFSPELVKRHENAHCNGWPADHGGARSILSTLPFVPDNIDALADVAAQFDDFARSAVGKTVAQVAANLAQSDWTAAAQFVLAAKGLGRAPDAQVTKEILSNPVTAAPLGRAVGIGTDLSDEQWRQAHALAFQASKARQRER